MEEENIILKSKVAREVLLKLKEKEVSYGFKISCDIDRVYAQTNKIIRILIEKGLIEIQKKQGYGTGMKYNSKRNRYIKLTELGNRIADCLINLNDLIFKI